MTYLIMTLLGLLAFAQVLSRSHRKAELWALYLVATALVTLADWAAFGWFQLYTYRPHLLAGQIPDGALGEFLADLLFVPAVSTALVATLPGLAANLLGTGLFAGLEYWFLRSGLFTHSGWQVWYSAVGFLCYFPLLTRLWRGLTAGGYRPDWLPTLLRVSAHFDVLGLLTLYLRARSLVYTNIHIMRTPLGDQSIGRFITYPCLVVPLGLWVCRAQGPQRWTRLGLITTGLVLYNAALTRLNFQFFLPPWSGPLDALAQGGVLGVASVASNGILAALGAEERPRVQT